MAWALDLVALAAYPVAAWLVLTQATVAGAGWLLFVALVPRTYLLVSRAKSANWRSIAGPPLAVATLVGLAIVCDDARFVLAVPTLVALTLLLAFGHSLAATPMVEQYARLVQPQLTEAEVRHCRQATWLWCGFFVVNGAISLTLALRPDPTPWALYTGVYCYVAMAGLFGLEYAVRVMRFGFLRATPGWKPGRAAGRTS